MFDYIIQTASATQVVIATEYQPEFLNLTLPNGETATIKVDNLAQAIDAYREYQALEKATRARLLETISEYPTNRLKMIVNSWYGKSVSK